MATSENFLFLSLVKMTLKYLFAEHKRKKVVQSLTSEKEGPCISHKRFVLHNYYLLLRASRTSGVCMGVCWGMARLGGGRRSQLVDWEDSRRMGEAVGGGIICSVRR